MTAVEDVAGIWARHLSLLDKLRPMAELTSSYAYAMRRDHTLRLIEWDCEEKSWYHYDCAFRNRIYCDDADLLGWLEDVEEDGP